MGAQRVEQIGDATLYLGDCLDVMPTLGINTVAMIFCDPPYGHNNHINDRNSRLNEHRGIEGAPIANDDPDSFRRVVDSMLKLSLRVLPSKSSVCCCCGGGGGGPRPTFAWLAERMDRDGLEFFHSIIWDKNNPGLGERYRRQHEMILVARRADGTLRWPDKSLRQRNVIAMSPPKDRAHPNEKPVALCQIFIRVHTAAGDVVLDPFMGSGSTGAACLTMGRKFIGIEIDEVHFEKACERIAAAEKQPRLFAEPKMKIEQGVIL